MIKNINKPSEFPCSGCGACVSVCPKNAVSLSLDNAGFFTANIDESLCIDCGLCQRVCARYDQIIEGVNLYDAQLFAMQSSDEKIVKKCTSGGFAHELSVEAINNGYKVVGAVYDTESDSVVHKIVESVENVSLLDGSKYLQSNTQPAFRTVIEEAKKNSDARFAVFGTPCQIAGIVKAAKTAGVRDSFILVEIFCHGVPSYKLWNKECSYLRQKLSADKFDSVLFRYKKDDWHSYCLKVDANGKIYFGARETDLFWQVFFENVLLGPACQTCRMRKENSLADLRIGDYWGQKFEHRSDGVSAVFACTKQGENAVCNLIKNQKLNRLDATDAKDMLSAQNMGGYHQSELYNKTIAVLREKDDVMDAINYYRSNQSGKQKLKRILLKVSAIIPDGLRAKLRKANSSRMLRKNNS